MKPLIIMGNSEIAKLAYEYFTHDSDYVVAGFSAEKNYCDSDEFLGLPLVPLENINTIYPAKDYHAFVAVGSSQLNYLRKYLYLKMKHKGYKLASYISSKAFAWQNVTIGDNCFILEDNTLQPFVKVGNNVTLWSGNHIGHSSIIHDHVFITSHVVVSGFCTIEQNCFLGVNSALAEQVSLGADNYISMSAAVNKSTAPNQFMMGIPAKPYRVDPLTYFEVKQREILHAN